MCLYMCGLLSDFAFFAVRGDFLVLHTKAFGLDLQLAPPWRKEGVFPRRCLRKFKIAHFFIFYYYYYIPIPYHYELEG